MKQLLLLFSVFTFALSAIAQTSNPAIDSPEAKHQKNPSNDALRQRFHQPDYQHNSNTNTVDNQVDETFALTHRCWDSFGVSLRDYQLQDSTFVRLQKVQM